MGRVPEGGGIGGRPRKRGVSGLVRGEKDRHRQPGLANGRMYLGEHYDGVQGTEGF